MNMNEDPRHSVPAAVAAARHYLSHTTNGWDGYNLDDVADVLGDVVIQFASGDMDWETDVAPLCDADCE